MSLVKKLLIPGAGAALLLSNAADAADYLIYSFAFSGNEARMSNAQPLLSYNGAMSGNIVYYLPTSFAGATFASVASTPLPGTSYLLAGSTLGNVFTLRETLTGSYRASTRDATIAACLTATGVDPACSTVAFTDTVSLGTQGSDVRRLTGTITGLTVTEGFGSVTLGLASYPLAQLQAAVPEPASWAMMILGVGAVGFALRRRRAQPAPRAI